MDRVVGYDYPIDNKEEIKMEIIVIRDLYFDELAVDVRQANSNERTAVGNAKVIQVDFDWRNDGDYPSAMRYSPEQARKLAAALIKAAEAAEAEVYEQ